MIRVTAYREVCPQCEAVQEWSDEHYCTWCGCDYGLAWKTVEVDHETGVIVRTVIPAQYGPPTGGDDDLYAVAQAGSISGLCNDYDFAIGPAGNLGGTEL